MSLIAGAEAGIAGFKAALDNLDRTARRIAGGGAESDPAQAMVELNVEEASAKLNLEVIRTADAMLGSILDLVR